MGTVEMRDISEAFLEVYARLDGSQHCITGTEHTFEQRKSL
jgi:hypothetical protein